MKKLFVVAIKKDYTELEFEFADFYQMSDFIKMIMEFSDYEVIIKQTKLPFSESEGDGE